MGYGSYEIPKLILAQLISSASVKEKSRALTPEQKEKNRIAAKEKRDKIRQENLAQAELIKRHRQEELEKRTKAKQEEDNLYKTFGPAQHIMFNQFDCLEASHRRSVILSKATPKWADKEKIKAIYEQRDKLNECGPDDPYHVDHIYPLQGKLVCGLNVAENMQLLTRRMNSIKRNKFTCE